MRIISTSSYCELAACRLWEVREVLSSTSPMEEGGSSAYLVYDETLSSFKSLDLSGLISRQNGETLRRGGYGIVSTGYLRQDGRECKIAIKELIIRIQGRGSPTRQVQKASVPASLINCIVGLMSVISSISSGS